ncbi:MAG: hypothetical protein JOZ54_17480, partial [Acidobacteria bacterium]|nr:hypothetical protein [Acidobacteriota bacterium]
GEPPAATFDELIEETIHFCEEFDRTRPPREIHVPDVDRRKYSRNPKGKTGREEWT